MMTSFSVVRKKTPFQKHREEEEAKKKVLCAVWVIHPFVSLKCCSRKLYRSEEHELIRVYALDGAACR